MIPENQGMMLPKSLQPKLRLEFPNVKYPKDEAPRRPIQYAFHDVKFDVKHLVVILL